MKLIPGISQLRLHPLLIVGQLLLIAVLAFMASQRELTLILFLPLVVSLVLAFMRWPTFGLIVASLAGVIVPYRGPSGLNVTMILVALLLGLWLLDMVVRKGQIQLAPSRAVFPLLAFIVMGFFSLGVGQLPWYAFALHAPLGAQLGGLAIVLLSGGTFLLAANQIRDLDQLSKLTWAFLIFGGLSVVIRWALPMVGVSTGELIRPMGTVFYICLVAMAFSQAVFNRDLRTGWRIALVGLVLFTQYILFVIKFNDKSAWTSTFICLAAIIAIRSWRAGLALVPIAVLFTLYLRAGVAVTEEYTLSTRLDAWIIMAQIIKLSPLAGLGFANYYWYTPLYRIRGYDVSFNSHNNYIDIIAQTGVLGLILFVWFLWEVGRLGNALRDRVPAGFAQAYVYGALGVLVGVAVAAMLGDWVLPFFYNIGLDGFRSSMHGWLFMGGLVSLEQLVKTQKLTAARK